MNGEAYQKRLSVDLLMDVKWDGVSFLSMIKKKGHQTTKNSKRNKKNSRNTIIQKAKHRHTDTLELGRWFKIIVKSKEYNELSKYGGLKRHISRKDQPIVLHALV